MLGNSPNTTTTTTTTTTMTTTMTTAAAAAAAAIAFPGNLDYRSDTVTVPTKAMLEAMSSAAVGDDVYGDDPTVNELQAYAAKLLGKEAALFVPSGTMGNLICVLTHCRERGSEYIVSDQAHIHYYEQGGTATLGGVHPRPLATNADGTMSLELIEGAIRPLDDHYPTTRLVCLENTHNRCGGRVVPKSYIDAVGVLCRKHQLALHMDGARIMNAAVALGIDVKELVASCDSVSLCLSKGLAAPVGSVIAGTKDFIFHARRLRKALGGGMRQAGTIAAAGLVALRTMVDRLRDDHENAKALAVGLSQVPGLSVDPAIVDTNILFVGLTKDFPMTAVEFRDALNAHGIRLSVTYFDRIRFVVHYMMSRADIEFTLKVIRECASAKKTTTSA